MNIVDKIAFNLSVLVTIGMVSIPAKYLAEEVGFIFSFIYFLLITITFVYLKSSGNEYSEPELLIPERLRPVSDVEIKSCETDDFNMKYKTLDEYILISEDILAKYYSGKIGEGAFRYLMRHEEGHHNSRKLILLSMLITATIFSLGLSFSFYVDVGLVTEVVLSLIIILVCRVILNYRKMYLEKVADRYAMENVEIEIVEELYGLEDTEKASFYDVLKSKYPDKRHRKRWLYD